VAKALDTPGRSLRSTPGAKKHLEVQEEGAPPRAAGFTPISTKKPQLSALEAVLKGQYDQYADKKPKPSTPKRKAATKEPTDDDVFLVEKVRAHAAPHSFHLCLSFPRFSFLFARPGGGFEVGTNRRCGSLGRKRGL